VLDSLRDARVRYVALALGLALVANLLVAGARPVAVGLFQPPWDKVAHLSYFAALGGLFGIAAGGERLWRAVLPLALFACGEEWRQAYLPGREAGWEDVVANFAGIAAGLVVARLVVRARRRSV
jgi:VanZ family protein